ncbi:YbdD/YjiX family protein [Microbacterium sp. M28]|uniref:YbdD/YjiX family protein n=1 Tax=Microbacterium sp. M28 TaxID=2962064 RepID=UPI0021F4A202|nr:YbdD/YjiX family protein [Microbacterium sp. M28]UYO96714.1 YbdD/YjiX family protein [Microbacterium sp. M28]
MTTRADAATGPMRAIIAFIGRARRGIRWYVTNLMGDSAYATYVAHQRRLHPDEEPMSERQFWRQKMDDQDRNPGARCC